MFFRTQALCALAAAGLLLGLSANSHADSLKVKTEQGKVVGKTINNGKVRAFMGLPYAAPPVGDLRWKAPQPPAKWKGERDATKYGAHCAQGRVFDDMVFQDAGPSEDCLFLNVYTPADAKKKSKLPVMFWIHGGGYSGGGSSEPRHNGDFLPLKGVVLVTINYRLGVFGFLVTDELAKENNGVAGNYGLHGHGGRAPVGEEQHRRVRRRSEQRDDLWRERGIVCGEHADGFADGAGTVCEGDWRERRGVSECAESWRTERDGAGRDRRQVGGDAGREEPCGAARDADGQDAGSGEEQRA